MSADQGRGVDEDAPTRRKLLEEDNEHIKDAMRALLKSLETEFEDDPSPMWHTRVMGWSIWVLIRRVQALEAKLSGIGDGEKRTASATTPTCANIEGSHDLADSADSAELQFCPTCGKPNRTMTGAERQRRWREKNG